MSSKELDLEFDFSNDELANFLDNFADKIREGEVGLSFKGREEINIEPTRDSELSLDFEEEESYRELEIKIKLREEIETSEEGRRKIEVQIV
ncbi:MAG: amphi-Trp domain-containing protein [Colwellia polaris]|jgi:amphi-Trp domain-containing protein